MTDISVKIVNSRIISLVLQWRHFLEKSLDILEAHCFYGTFTFDLRK